MGSLSPPRAIENPAYVVSADRGGFDGADLPLQATDGMSTQPEVIERLGRFRLV